MGVRVRLGLRRDRDLARVSIKPRNRGRALLHKYMLEEPETTDAPTLGSSDTERALAVPEDPVPQIPQKRPARLRAHGLEVLLGTDPQGEPVLWNAADQINPFVALVGSSGSGKTNALRLFATSARGAKVPVLLFDVHGDLRLRGLPSYPIGRRHYSVNPLALPAALAEQGPSLSAAPLVAAANLGRVQQQTLREAIAQVYERAQKTRTLPTLQALRELLREQPGASAQGLYAAVASVYDEGSFSGRELPLSLLLTSGGHVDLTPLGGNDRAQLLVAQALLTQVWGELQSRGPLPAEGGLRVLVVLDEAARLKNSVIVDRLIREGRKFGLGMCIAAQLPEDLSEAVREHAGTALVLPLLGSYRDAAKMLGRAQGPQVSQLARKGDAWVRDRDNTGAPRLRRVQLRLAEEGQ